MDNPENPTPSQDDFDQLQEQYDSLRNVIVWILVLLVVVSATFTLYLERLRKEQHQELEAVRPQVSAYQQYDKAAAPARDKFIGELIQYGASHPDFAPILAKYGLTKYTPKPAASGLASPPPSSVPVPLPANK